MMSVTTNGIGVGATLTKNEVAQVELAVEGLLAGCGGKADALPYIGRVIDEDFPGAPNRPALIEEATRYLNAA